MTSLGLYGKRQEMNVKIKALSAWIIQTKLVLGLESTVCKQPLKFCNVSSKGLHFLVKIMKNSTLTRN